jgi:hypothetical protein
MASKEVAIAFKGNSTKKRRKSSLQPLQTLLENVAPKPSAECAHPADGAQELHVLLSRDCLDVIAPMFVQVFRNLKSMIEKEDMQWTTMLRIAHEQSPIPLIGEAMRMMVKRLQPLQTLLENVAPKPSAECANPPDGAQVLHVLLSRDCLDVIAPMFVQVFRNLKSMIEKEDMQWTTMLRIAHEQSPIPLIGEAMCMMVKRLQQEEATDSVVELGERDV